METHTLFLHLLLILISARLFGELLARLGAPSVVGELLAGVVIGPSLFGWVEVNEVIRLLAEFGVILLLFEVGLESDSARLMRAGRSAVVVAVAGFILPFLLGFALAYWLFGLEALTSLFIGGTLTATSIGITLRVLNDLQLHHTHEAQVVLGAAVLDDVMGVLLLALLYDFALNDGVSLGNAAQVGLFIALFFILAPIMAKLACRLLCHVENHTLAPGLIPTMVFSIVLLFAWLAHAIGAPELLGGFAAGVALSRRFFLPFGLAIRTDTAFAMRIESSMRPIIHLFTPVFFVSVGLSLELRAIDWGSALIWALSFALLLAAIVGKLIGPLLLGLEWRQQLMIGVSMVPRGEVGLIFAELGRISGILQGEQHAALIIVIAITTLMAPFAMKRCYESRS